MKRTVELLAPAGNMECLRTAINAGADAIYIGGDRFGARAYAENFDQEALCEALDYAHLFGRRVYLTLNTLLKEEELLQIPSYVSPFYEAGLDGVIVQDFGVVRILKKYFADLKLHASTQMTVTGADGARLLREQGICRVVPARELSLQEIARIKQEAGVEVEAFIHGAMCYCYSGQCLFSSFLGGRSGNRGRCAGPCRLPYDIVGENGRVNSKAEQYPLSLKDLGVLPILPKLIGACIDSFKIEGRMKSPEYVAGVTSIYRKYIDLYMQSQSGFAIEPEDLRHLKSLYTRGAMETGYYERKNGRSMVTLSKGGYENAVSDFGREMKSRYVDASRKLPLRGRAVLHIGEPARLTLETAGAPGGTEPQGQLAAERGDVRFEAVGDTAVQEAQNCPMQETDIKKQLFKTGNTVFEIGELIIEKDSKVFLPN
ncbi:MAG: U32 family peptidase, partial [Lachnospiraceae bacterium]|nr:U32 family peptidase [Lachnospiraceae bacterium]